MLYPIKKRKRVMENKKKAVKVNTSTKKDKVVKEPIKIKTFTQEFYTDIYTFQTMPIPEHYFDHIAAEWIDYVKNTDDVLFMGEYRIKKGISRTTFEEWTQRSPNMQIARAFVKEIIAMRREKGALMRKYDAGTVFKMQYKYDSDWKEMEEWRASLKEKVEGPSGSNITVVMERFPNSPLVPEKRKIEQE